MTDPNEPVEINLDQLRQHQGRLDGVGDLIRAAHDAAGAPVGGDAFGAFGFVLARDCASAAAEGAAMLLAAHEAADEHYQKVGVWRGDTAATEGEVTALFSTAPEMRDA